MPLPRVAAFAVVMAAAVALGGCGRKGDPEYPEGTQTRTVTRPDGKDKKEPVKPTRRFVLDGLLN